MTRYHRHVHGKARKTLAVKKTTRPKIVDRLVYFVAIVEPLCSIPQAYQIYHDKSAGSVSLLAWIGFELLTLIWLWYGIEHREKMILIYQGLFFVIDGSVVVGAIIYGGKLL